MRESKVSLPIELRDEDSLTSLASVRRKNRRLSNSKSMILNIKRSIDYVTPYLGDQKKDKVTKIVDDIVLGEQTIKSKRYVKLRTELSHLIG